MKRREDWAWAAAAVALSGLLYFYVRMILPPDTTWLWIVPPYPEDGLSYLAWTRQAMLGAWLFKVKYTALPQAARLFNPVFLTAGKLAFLTGTAAGPVLFVVRSVGVGLFVFALGRFLRGLPLSVFQRRLATALVLLSSGFGGLVGGVLPRALRPAFEPPDIWIVDANTLWSLCVNPVFGYAMALLLSVFSLLAEASERPRRLALAGALTSLLAFVHPYDAATALAVATTAYLLRRGPAVRWAAFAAAAAPGIAYQAWLGLRDPVLSRHVQRGLMVSPTPYGLLWGFGLPGILAAAGLVLLWRRRRLKEFRIVLLWAACSLFLVYAPVWFQRKLLAGLHIPLCVLAAVAADAAIGRVAGRRRPFAAVGLLVLATMCSHVYNWRKGIHELRGYGDRGPYLLGPVMREALDALAAEKRPDEIVLAGLTPSTLIPAWTGNTVLYGHWAQSVDEDERVKWIIKLLSPDAKISDERRAAMIREAGVGYVLMDNELRRLAGGATPAWLLSAGQVLYRGSDFELLRLRVQ